MLSEALTAAGGLLDASPYRSQAGDSYIGVLAKLLMEYPRSVALKCADPLRGVSRETKFLPTVADIVAWCENETEPLRGHVEYERRVEAQLRAREEWRNQRPNEDHRKLAEAWLNRTDPACKKFSHLAKTFGAMTLEQQEVARRINRAFFDRECAAAGVDPSRGVSPSLLKLLGEQNAGA